MLKFSTRHSAVSEIFANNANKTTLNLFSIRKFFKSVLLIISLIGWVTAMYSQPVQSPCGCLGPTEIGRTGSSYDISDLSYSLTSGTCYLVKGILVIDQNTIWSGIRLLMEEKSKILVKANVTLALDDCYLSGCDDLWQGIETESDSELFVHDSYIESANIAIRLGNLTVFECTGNEFIDNYIGISVGSPFEAVPSSTTQISQKGGILGCKFYTDDVVPDPYPGHFYSSWPTTPSEIPFDQGYAAVFVARSVGLNLGLHTASVANRNEIYHMRNGVININSDIHIGATDFYDFEGSVYIDPNIPADDPPATLLINQYAMMSISSPDLTASNNTIDNIMRGGYGQWSSTTYKDNTIDVRNTGSDLQLTRGLMAKNSNFFVAEDNVINDGNRGIFINGAFNRLDLIDNVLDMTLANGKGAGIEIFFGKFVLNQSNIENNDIEINNASKSYGFSLNTCSGLILDNNDIYFDDDLGGAGNYNAGISAIETDQCLFTRNDVLADRDYIDEDHNYGMVFTNSERNGFLCNTIDSMHTLLRFIGDCHHTNLIATEFERGRVAFELLSPVVIGEQDQNGNEWLHSYDDGGAIITGHDDPYDVAINSTFFYNNTPTGAEPQLPHDIRPAIIDDGTWFSYDGTGTGKTCEEDDPDIAPDSDSLANLILNLPQFDTLNDQMTWMIKSNVFNLMLLDTSLANNSTLDSFFDAEALKPLGKLVTAHYDLDNRYGINFKDKINTHDTILSLSNDIVYIDSILTLSPNDSATWISLRVLKVDTLSDRVDSWIEFMEDESSESEDQYEEIRHSIAVISTSSDIEEYYQDALLFKADFMLGDTITTSDSSDIADLAELCPWEGGPALAIAQALLNILTDSTATVVPYDCPPPPSPLINLPDHQYSTNDGLELEIFPNPAMDFISIQASTEIDKIILTSPSLKQVENFEPKANSASLNLARFPAGVYLLSICSGDLIETRKVILIK